MTEAADQKMVGKVFGAISWTAAGGAFQFFLSLLLFAGIALYLSPTLLGLWGLCMLLISFAEMFGVKSFTEVLQQREEISKKHIYTIFSTCLIISILMAIFLITAPQYINVELLQNAAPYLSVLALMLPVCAANNVLQSLLARDLRFAETAKVGMLATILNAIATIVGLFAGLGLWALVIGDIVRRLTRLVGFYLSNRVALKFHFDWPAFRQTAKFNRDTFATYMLGYLDGNLPKWFVAIFLGAEGLGHFVLAERAIALLRKLVLSPFASVTMAAIARVQTDGKALQDLVLSLYRGAAIIGYPAFIGAALVVTDFAEILGDKWVLAAFAAQIMLLSGIRTTTGAFNVAILRGVGRTKAPLVLIFAGVATYLFTLPWLGETVVGVAICVLLRSLLTWPLGMNFIKQATDLSFLQQARAGSTALICSLLMGATLLGGSYFLVDFTSITKIALLILVGMMSYAVYIFLLDRKQFMVTMRLFKRKKIR